MFADIQTKIQDEIDKIIGNDQTNINQKTLESGFKVPMMYLPSDVYELNETVTTDLELCQEFDNSSISMHHQLMNTKNEFSEKMLYQQSRYYTNNIGYLEDTQGVIANMDNYNKEIDKNQYDLQFNDFNDIWRDTKQTPNFLEKYSYIDWKILRHFNESESFLQVLSLSNMMSPVISFILPLIFLLLPFIIIKLKGIEISFSTYLTTLKEVAKHHIIGKLLNVQKMDISSLMYLLFTVSLYALQIYQNFNACRKFYKNIEKVNRQLIGLRNYLKHTIDSMEIFSKINQECIYYNEFLIETIHHKDTLVQLHQSLERIEIFEPNLSKITEIGKLLKLYYTVYSNKEYENSLHYSFGYNGYIENLKGIFENVQHGHLSYAEFDVSQNTSFEGQYYPKYIESDHVKNNCDLQKMIITGPNASGKTTFLKTTAINIIFCQQYGVGFFSQCTLNPYVHIHSYLNIPDTSGRDSLFQAESRRCKDILSSIKTHNNDRHFTIFDELFSGTNPKEATKSAYAFLLYLCDYKNVDVILTTHYCDICKNLGKKNKVENYKMDVNIDSSNNINYTYKIKKGISKVEGATLILKDMNYPSEILDTIENYDDIDKKE